MAFIFALRKMSVITR